MAEEKVENISSLQKLNRGLLFLHTKREIEDEKYLAMDRIMFGGQVVRDRKTYAAELLRVLRDLKLTTGLIKDISDVPQLIKVSYVNLKI
jgi:hypothetical protein